MIKVTVEIPVRSFFAQLNWDNRPIAASQDQPMPLMRVKDFMATIPWNGDPLQLVSKSLSSILTPELVAELEDTFTLSELTDLF